MSNERPSSSVLRERYTRDYLLPLARAWFQLEPRCQSVLVTVGQYWCDEATDAVHCHQLGCVEAEPTWPESGQARAGSLVEDDVLAEWTGGPSPDEEALALSDVQSSRWERAAEHAFGEAYGVPSALDENNDMIVAFASFCREVSDQEQPSWRSHTPYGLIRRPAAGTEPVLEVIGKMHRPEWEDRWDVLEQDGIITEAEANAPSQVTEPSRSLSSGHSAAQRSSQPAEAMASSWTRVLAFLLLIAAIVAVRACRD